MKKNKNRKTVLIGMSGGLDSSVAAYLLNKRGFEVVGVYLKMNMQRKDEGFKKAREAAALLGIQFISKNISTFFKSCIIDDFVKKYSEHLTPNPCVLCNSEIKFKFLNKIAQEKKIAFIATGHYARIRRDKNGFLNLLKGRDDHKDQSYFLYRLKQNILKKTILPLGGIKKDQVRKIFEESILTDLELEKESQDICFFLTREKLSRFLIKNLKKKKKGKIVNEEGVSLGFHGGLELYTKGQRQGLGLSGGPYFVVGKNIRKGELIVSKNKDSRKLLNAQIILEKINWIGQKPQIDKDYYFKIRYSAKPVRGIFKMKNGYWAVLLSSSQWGVANGQSVVAYDGQKVIGGGIIKKVID